MASMALDGGFGERAGVVVSSHFCTAERQYRTPLEYGCQRTPTAQWTVTGAGAVILQRGGDGPCITHVTPGKIVDKGVTDTNNMGAAMAPAAAATLLHYLKDTDCGRLIFDSRRQDVHCGGSGCGCSASVFTGYLLRELRTGRIKHLLFCPTGALHSPTTAFQGESIPGICHAVAVSARRDG